MLHELAAGCSREGDWQLSAVGLLLGACVALLTLMRCQRGPPLAPMKAKRPLSSVALQHTSQNHSSSDKGVAGACRRLSMT